MKKLALTALATLFILLPCAHADKLTFDPSTREGRSQAYAAMNEFNAVGNANRLIRNLNSLQRSNKDLSPLASKLIPQLQELVKQLNGDNNISSNQ